MNLLVEDVAVCSGSSCRARYDTSDGWAGYCPSCLALCDEHLTEDHPDGVDGCPYCH